MHKNLNSIGFNVHVVIVSILCQVVIKLVRHYSHQNFKTRLLERNKTNFTIFSYLTSKLSSSMQTLKFQKLNRNELSNLISNRSCLEKKVCYEVYCQLEHSSIVRVQIFVLYISKIRTFMLTITKKINPKVSLGPIIIVIILLLTYHQRNM